MRHLILILIIIIINFNWVISQQQEPLPNPISQTLNGTGAVITSDYGPRNYGSSYTVDFHPGIDYQANAYDNIHLIDTGEISLLHIDATLNNFGDIAYITVGRWKYQHIQPSDHSPNWGVYRDYKGSSECDFIIIHEGTDITIFGSTACAEDTFTEDNVNHYPIIKNIENTDDLVLLCGNVWAGGPHLHLQYDYEFGRHNPLEFIGYDRWNENEPTYYNVTNSIKYVSATNTAQAFSDNNIYGNPIIIQSDIDYNQGKDLNEVIFEFSRDNLNFSILKNWKFADPNPTIVFTLNGTGLTSIESNVLNQYETAVEESIYPYYNEVSRDFYKYRWNSQQTTNSSTVLNPFNMVYPDGRYYIRFREINARNREASQTLERIIDNFRPFVKKVEIRDMPASSLPIYNREWIWNGSTLSITNEPFGAICDDNQDLWVKIYTSEPMESVSLTVFGNTYSPQSSYNNETEWVFSIPSSYTSNGYHILDISGTDLAGNPIEGFTSIQDVSTFSVRENDGSWSIMPYGNSDFIHSFSIGSVVVAPPSNLTAIFHPNTESIFLSWQNQAGGKYYKVYRGESNDFSSATSIEGWMSSTELYDYSAEPDKDYYYWVTTSSYSDGTDETAPSNFATASRPSTMFANFIAYQETYSLGDYIVQFIDQSKPEEEIDYFWDFGDNTTSTDQSPRHSYEQTGVYNVTLTVTHKLYSIPPYTTPIQTIEVTDVPIEDIIITPVVTDIDGYSYEFDLLFEGIDATYEKEISIVYGDGADDQLLYMLPANHTYTAPEDKTKHYLPYAQISIKNSYGVYILENAIYPFNYDIEGGIKIKTKDRTLELDITYPQLVIGESVSFEAICENGVGDITYQWLISKVPNQLEHTCSPDPEMKTCYAYTSGQNNNYADNFTPKLTFFEEEGLYLVSLFAVDSEGHRSDGYKDFIVTVSSSYGCASMNLEVINCERQDNFLQGSVVSVMLNIEDHSDCDGTSVGRVDWFLDDRIVGTSCELTYNVPPDMRYCYDFEEHELEPGLHYIGARMYMKRPDYNSGFGGLEIATAHKVDLSSVEKRPINIVECNSDHISVNSNYALAIANELNTIPNSMGSITIENESPAQIVLDHGANIHLTANERISIKSNFIANYGSKFSAKVSPCSSCSCADNIENNICISPNQPIDPNTIIVDHELVDECGFKHYVDIWYEVDDIYEELGILADIKVERLDKDWTGRKYWNPVRTYEDVAPRDKQLFEHRKTFCNRDYRAYVMQGGLMSNVDEFSVGFLGFDKSLIMDTSEITDITNLETINISGIYPNPTSGILNIELDNKHNKAKVLEIIDAVGRPMISSRIFKETDLTIDISHFMPGIYFVVIKTEDEIITEKIIKQ